LLDFSGISNRAEQVAKNGDLPVELQSLAPHWGLSDAQGAFYQGFVDLKPCSKTLLLSLFLSPFLQYL